MCAMIVCVCKSVSDRQIKACVDAGATSLEELQVDLGVALCCGKCEDYVREMLDGAPCGIACAGRSASQPCPGQSAEPREAALAA